MPVTATIVIINNNNRNKLKLLLRRHQQQPYKSYSYGQVSAIGTLLAITIFIMIFTLIVTQYVPRWMTDREASHLKAVANDFAALKSHIDLQIQYAQMTNSKSLTLYSAITVGEPGVALFAPDISGTLTLNGYVNSCVIKNATIVFATGNGNIHYDSNNIYYIDIDYIYEFGTVIIFQPRGSFIKIGPQFNVIKTAQGLSINIVIPTLTALTDSIAGSEVFGVQTQVVTYQNHEYIWDAGDETVIIELTSRYVSAWLNYFRSLFELKGLIEGTAYDYTLEQTATDSLTLTFYNVYELNAGAAGVDTRLEYGR